MITILIPLADGESIHKWTLNSIAMQDVDCCLVPISRPRQENFRLSEAECRNELKKYASDPYAFYLDSDAYFTRPTDVSDCIRWLHDNSEYGAVALDTKHVGSIEKCEARRHVIIAAMCIRKFVLDAIEFRQLFEEGKELCLCRALNEDVKIKYLDHRVLGEVCRK